MVLFHHAELGQDRYKIQKCLIWTEISKVLEVGLTLCILRHDDVFYQY